MTEQLSSSSPILQLRKPRPRKIDIQKLVCGKIWIPSQCCGCFLTTPCSLQDLSSPTRDWTQAMAVKALSFNHSTTREFPHGNVFLIQILFSLHHPKVPLVFFEHLQYISSENMFEKCLAHSRCSKIFVEWMNEPDKISSLVIKWGIQSTRGWKHVNTPTTIWYKWHRYELRAVRAQNKEFFGSNIRF